MAALLQPCERKEARMFAIPWIIEVFAAVAVIDLAASASGMK